MLRDEIEVYLRLRAAEGRTIECLLEQVARGENPEAALALLRRLADSNRETDSPTASAITYLSGMCQALDEQEFRALGLEQPPEEVRRTRRERIALYHRYRELFELEITYVRRQKAQAMALRKDWSGARDYLKESLSLARSRAMLRTAGWLYHLQLPGAKDMCEAAAYALFKMLYLPAQNARAAASL